MTPVLFLLACPAPPAPTVTVEGPAELRIDTLGPVDLPAVTLRAGDEVVAESPVWAVDDASVARVDGGRLETLAAGKAQVTASWRGASAAIALVVDPAMTLSFLQPPATVLVGGTAQLLAVGHVGQSPAIVEGAPAYSSSNEAFATVSPAGLLTAVSPGVVYVTAKQGSSEAMVEIEVVAPPAP